MLTAEQLKGIYVPLVTPFRDGGELDLDSIGTNAQAVADAGAHGLVVNGTTGEAPTVAWEEVAVQFREIRERMAGRSSVPIVIGTGTNDTAATARRTEAAGKLGADAALVVVPYYSRPSQEGIVAHYREAASAGVPVIAYEIPSRTGIRLEPETAQAILELDGVIGIKDSSGGTRLIAELKRLGCAKPILCGEDAFFYAMLREGAAGGILASANCRTAGFADVWRLALAGRYQEAEAAFGRLLPMIRLLFREPNPAPFKYVLAKRRRISSDTLRLPMTPASSALRPELDRLARALDAEEAAGAAGA